MSLIDYIEPTKVTIAILKDWRDQEWKYENGSYKLAEMNDRMTSISSRAGTTPVQGGASKTEEILCAAIDKKTVELHKYTKAQQYINEIRPCWDKLTKDEQFVLECRYIDRDEHRGIERIMARYFISKSEAYRRSDSALKRLSTLLFW